jgi:stress-induced morphogen
MISEPELVAKLKQSFPNAKIQAKDLTGGGDHWHVSIEASEFSGKSLVEQHQLVYKALGDWMKREIHALSLATKGV